MGRGSSGHFAKGHEGYFSHNDRSSPTKNTIFSDEKNEIFNDSKEAFELYREELKKRAFEFTKRTGQKLQKTIAAQRSLIINLEKHHTLKNLQPIVKHIEQSLDTKILQIAIHRDEGHIDPETKEEIKNYHAHIELMGIDSHGISIAQHQNKNTSKIKVQPTRTSRLDSKFYSEFQTFLANTLGMQRGVKNSKAKRLDTYQYKQEAKIRSDIKIEMKKKKEFEKEQEIFFIENENYLKVSDLKKALEDERQKMKDEKVYTKEDYQALSNLKKATNKGSLKEIAQLFFEMQKKHREFENENKNLKKTIEKHQKKSVFETVFSREKQLSEAQEELSKAQKIVKELEASKINQDKNIKTLSNNLSEAENRASEANETIKKQSASISSKESKIKELEASKINQDKNIKTLSEAENRASKAQEELLSKESKIEELEASKKELEASKINQDNDIKTLEDRASEAQEELLSKESKIEELEASKINQDNDIKTLEDRASEAQEELLSKESKIEELEASKINQDNDIKTLEDRASEAQEELLSKESKIEELEASKQLLEQELKNYRNKDRQEKRKELNAAKRELLEAQKQLTNAHEIIKNLKSTLSSKELEIRGLQDKINTLQTPKKPEPEPEVEEPILDDDEFDIIEDEDEKQALEDEKPILFVYDDRKGERVAKEVENFDNLERLIKNDEYSDVSTKNGEIEQSNYLYYYINNYINSKKISIEEVEKKFKNFGLESMIFYDKRDENMFKIIVQTTEKINFASESEFGSFQEKIAKKLDIYESVDKDILFNNYRSIPPEYGDVATIKTAGNLLNINRTDGFNEKQKVTKHQENAPKQEDETVQNILNL